MADEFYDHPDVRSAVRAVLYSKGIRDEHDLADGVQQVITDCIAQDRRLGRTPKDVPQAKAWVIAAAETDGIDAIRKRVHQGKSNEGPTPDADLNPKEAGSTIDPMVREPAREVVEKTLTPAQRQKFVDIGSGVSQKELARHAGQSETAFRKQTERERKEFKAAWRRAGPPLAVGAVLVTGAALLGVNAFRDRGEVTKSPREHAAEQRHLAADACKAHQWDECEKALNRAQQADPEGETTNEVKEIREAIEKGRGAEGK
jgi:hypothetical protein